MARAVGIAWVTTLVAPVLAGCAGADMSSTLAPAGTEAEAIARLFWIMVAGAGVVWLAVVGIALYACLRPGPRGRRAGRWLIIGGGVVAPTVVLGALLLHGLLLMPRLRAPAGPEGPYIAVSGEQWWWRVRYVGFGAGSGADDVVELANELHLPVGARVRLRLDSPDVIHSFWIPSLAGKVDMIPGRATTLLLEPTRTGAFRGACAEYCGTAHAQMRFMAVVEEPDRFERWLRAQAAPAPAPRTTAQKAGRRAFVRNGCGACHAIRGTTARGAVGPDLTHVGGRLELAAGALPNDADAFARWIAATHAVKPDALMPPFATLPEGELRAMALYLDGLQ